MNNITAWAIVPKYVTTVTVNNPKRYPSAQTEFLRI